MSEREDRTNRQLRALEAGYRHGQFDRADYRARRREVLSALRVRDEITARNAIVPTARPCGGGGGYEGQDRASSILFDSRAPVLSRWLLFALLAGIAVLALVFIWFVSGGAHVQ